MPVRTWSYSAFGRHITTVSTCQTRIDQEACHARQYPRAKKEEKPCVYMHGQGSTSSVPRTGWPGHDGAIYDDVSLQYTAYCCRWGADVLFFLCSLSTGGAAAVQGQTA